MTMRAGRRCRLLVDCALLASASTLAAPAWAQDAPPVQDAEPPLADESPLGGMEIVVTGIRGSAVTDIAPLATLDADAVAATGATSVPELLRTIKGATTSADGSEPVFLLNAQRISGYQEIGTLPPEAIEKVEVLPEQAALRFGYPPTRRVVNFITKRRFRQIELRGSAGVATRGGAEAGTANLGLTRLRDNGRLTLGLELRHTEPVQGSQRRALPDPDILFDPVGNVRGVNGEIDPALSAAAGRPVLVAPVRGDPTSLSGYLAGANQPRLFDVNPYRSFSPRNDAIKADGALAGKVTGSISGSLSLSAEQSRDRNLGGPASAILSLPGTNPYSPFAGPVLLYRYLTEAEALRQRQTTTTLHAGALLRGALDGWRWDVTGTLDQKQIDGVNVRGIDMTAANAAIAAGANPFAPLDDALLANRLVDRSRQRTRSMGLQALATKMPFRLPAGPVTVTATLEAERATASSSTRGPDPFDLQLGRTRGEGSIALDLPLTSRRQDVLADAGDVSASLSLRARTIGGFGSLYDSTYGLSWAPIDGIQLLGTVKYSEAAPDLAQQSTPVTSIPDVPVFDFGNGRTTLVTLIQGGNPDLRPERRLVRSLTLNVKPFAKKELRLGITYESTTIRDQTGTVYALTPQTEALLPDLIVRDAAGELRSVAFRPINFYRERQRTLNVTFNASGMIGKPPLPPPPPPTALAPSGRAKPPVQPPFYYGGIGPSVKFSDRLQLRPGTPELDVLGGDTVTGGGNPRVFGYLYGGLFYMGNGINMDAWYGGGSRVRSDDPAADLRFAPIFKLNIGGFVSVHHFLRDQDWARKLQLRLDVNNLTDARQQVRDANGRVPYRFQPAYLDPVGRTVKLSLRKLF